MNPNPRRFFVPQYADEIAAVMDAQRDLARAQTCRSETPELRQVVIAALARLMRQIRRDVAVEVARDAS